MSDQGRINALYGSQEDLDIERELRDALPDLVEPQRGATKHLADMYEILLETGRKAYFKPMSAYATADTAVKRALVSYAHTPLSATIGEGAAWQIAKHLGGVWGEIVTPCVVRSIRIDGRPEIGALSVHRPGRDRALEYFRLVPDQASAGAFFDSLIGQQDRNKGNVRWHEPRFQIHLIDHAFSFGRRGDRAGHLELTEWRWHHGDRDLTVAERGAVAAVLENDLFGLGEYLEADRVEALRRRAEEMLAGGQILELRVL